MLYFLIILGAVIAFVYFMAVAVQNMRDAR